MKVPELLFDVPRRIPIRERRRQQIKQFKIARQIWTHCGPCEIPERWSALLVPKAREEFRCPELEPMEIIARECAALEYYNLLVTGDTEREAIKNLCALNFIECPLK